MEEYKQKINEIEKEIKFTQYYTEFKDKFIEVRNWANSYDMKQIEELAQFEIEICSLSTRDPNFLFNEKNETRFVSQITYENGQKFPDIEGFKENQYEYYDNRLKETDNDFLKVRYADFLFEYNKKSKINKYEIFLELCSALVNVINIYHDKENDFQLIQSIARLTEISLLMNNKDKVNKTIEIINQQIQKYNDNEAFFIIKLSIILREIASKYEELVSEDLLNNIMELLWETREENYKKEYYNSYREINNEILEYRKLNLITEEKMTDLEKEIGISYEFEAEQTDSLIPKFGILKSALKYYRNTGKTEKIKEIKILLKETINKLLESDEMKTVSASACIPDEYFEEKIKHYTSFDTLPETLDIIANFDNEFIPDVNAIRRITNNSMQDFSLLKIIPYSLIDDKKEIAVTTNTKENMEIEVNQFYRLELLKKGILLNKIIDSLVEKYKLDSEKIVKYIANKNLFDEKNKPFIEKGITHFFEEDYISALHILVPKFENTMRDIFSNAGYITTSLGKYNTQQEKTFNAFLDIEKIKTQLGSQIHKLIEFIMVDKTGFNLRNKIAHGLIKIEEVSKENCLLVIYLYLILVNIDLD